MTTSKIKLSAVICARNDDYGKNLLERAILCLNSMLDSFDEVFYVDWNTVSGKPSLLVDVYPYLTGDTTKLKHVCISPEQHKKFTAKDPFAAPVCEVLGRNVGIRRSSGTWVVSTNIDIIAPPREVLLAFIDNADERTFYTMARRNYDVDYNEWNHTNWKALRLSLGDIAPRQVKPLTEVINGKPSDHGNYSVINYCGDFQLANETLWFDLRGFEERLLRAQFADTNVQKKQ